MFKPSRQATPATVYLEPTYTLPRTGQSEYPVHNGGFPVKAQYADLADLLGRQRGAGLPVCMFRPLFRDPAKLR